MKTALVLGGGAARGLAHIGVLRVLERERIPIDLIVGTSMGALVGGHYAAYRDALKLENDLDAFFRGPEYRKTQSRFLETMNNGGMKEPSFFFNAANFIKKGWVLSSGFRRRAVIDTHEIIESFERQLPDWRIEDLSIDFAAVALEVRTGWTVIIDRGRLREAVVASSAIPGVFPPVTRENGWVLVDGSWAEPVPVAAARKLGADVVIAVDVTDDLNDLQDLSKGINLFLRSNDAVMNRLKLELLQSADIVIRPEVTDVYWADFSRFSECRREGERATKAALGEIRAKIAYAKRWGWMNPRRKQAELKMRDRTALLERYEVGEIKESPLREEAQPADAPSAEGATDASNPKTPKQGKGNDHD